MCFGEILMMHPDLAESCLAWLIDASEITPMSTGGGWLAETLRCLYEWHMGLTKQTEGSLQVAQTGRKEQQCMITVCLTCDLRGEDVRAWSGQICGGRTKIAVGWQEAGLIDGDHDHHVAKIVAGRVDGRLVQVCTKIIACVTTNQLFQGFFIDDCGSLAGWTGGLIL